MGKILLNAHEGNPVAVKKLSFKHRLLKRVDAKSKSLSALKGPLFYSRKGKKRLLNPDDFSWLCFPFRGCGMSQKGALSGFFLTCSNLGFYVAKDLLEESQFSWISMTQSAQPELHTGLQERAKPRESSHFVSGTNSTWLRWLPAAFCWEGLEAWQAQPERVSGLISDTCQRLKHWKSWHFSFVFTTTALEAYIIMFTL